MLLATKWESNTSTLGFFLFHDEPPDCQFSVSGSGSRGSGGKQCKRNTQHCSIDDPAVFLLRIYSCMIHDLSPYPQKETGWQPLNPAFQYMFHSTKSQGNTFLSQAEFAIIQYTRITVRIQDAKPLKTKTPLPQSY